MELSIGRVAGLVVTPVAGATGEVLGGVAYVRRVSGKVEELLDRSIDLLATAAPVVEAVGQAVDDGLVDEVRDTLHRVDATLGRVERAAEHVDRALPRLDSTVQHLGTTLPLVDRTAKALHAAVPSITSLPSTAEELRLAREAAQHLVALVNLTLEQLDTLPGAAMVRRRMERLNAIEGADPGDV